MRHSVDKQEKVIALLWKLARQAQTEPKNGCVITAQDGTKMSDHVMRGALSEVMHVFGYDTVEIQ